MKNFVWIALNLFLLASCSRNDHEQEADALSNTQQETDSVKTGNELNEQTITALDDAQIFRFAASFPDLLRL